MSVAIITNDGQTTTFSTNTLQRRQITSLIFNQSSIVQNFRTADDTFQLAAGQYRFDCHFAGGINKNITARSNLTGGNQTLLNLDSELTEATVGIASYQRYDTSLFTNEAAQYYIGVATAISAADNYFQFVGHGLKPGDSIKFYGSVPPNITVGTEYGVSFSGIPAGDQDDLFKVLDLATSQIVDLTGSNLPIITKANLNAPRKLDQRPTVIRYKVTVPVGDVFTFSIQNLGSMFSTDGFPHGVTTQIGGVTVPSRYLTLRITKTD